MFERMWATGNWTSCEIYDSDTWGKKFGRFFYGQTAYTMPPNNPTLVYLPSRNESTCLHKQLYKNFHCSFIYNSQKLEIMQ